MGRYRLLFKKSIAKDLRAIPTKDVQRILKRITALAETPRPRADRAKRSEASLKQLLFEQLPAHNDQERYRIRQGAYRIVYEIHDDVLVIIVVKISHRSDAYS